MAKTCDTYNCFRKEEWFFHDHGKCIEARQAALELSLLSFRDTILPRHDSKDMMMEQAKSDPDIDSMHELEKLSMSEFSGLRKYCWNSPPYWPITLLRIRPLLLHGMSLNQSNLCLRKMTMTVSQDMHLECEAYRVDINYSICRIISPTVLIKSNYVQICQPIFRQES